MLDGSEAWDQPGNSCVFLSVSSLVTAFWASLLPPKGGPLKFMTPGVVCRPEALASPGSMLGVQTHSPSPVRVEKHFVPSPSNRYLEGSLQIPTFIEILALLMAVFSVCLLEIFSILFLAHYSALPQMWGSFASPDPKV